MPVGLISQLHMRVFRLAAFRRFSSASRETVSLEECRGLHGPARGFAIALIVQALTWFVSVSCSRDRCVVLQQFLVYAYAVMHSSYLHGCVYVLASDGRGCIGKGVKHSVQITTFLHL